MLARVSAMLQAGSLSEGNKMRHFAQVGNL